MPIRQSIAQDLSETDHGHPLAAASEAAPRPRDRLRHLSTPTGSARDNGLLQAWEIFEQMRFDAELVTLSACDTALGEELGGEGLISLTRAFQPEPWSRPCGRPSIARRPP